MFFSIIVSLWVLIHLYVGTTLAPVQWTGLWWLGIAFLTVLPVSAMVAGRRGRPGHLKDILEWTGFTSIGLSTMLLVLALAASLLHVRGWLDPRG